MNKYCVMCDGLLEEGNVVGDLLPALVCRRCGQTPAWYYEHEGEIVGYMRSLLDPIDWYKIPCLMEPYRSLAAKVDKLILACDRLSNAMDTSEGTFRIRLDDVVYFEHAVNATRE